MIYFTVTSKCSAYQPRILLILATLLQNSLKELLFNLTSYTSKCKFIQKMFFSKKTFFVDKRLIYPSRQKNIPDLRVNSLRTRSRGGKNLFDEMKILNFNKLNGLVPAIAQDYKTNEVLMQAFMNSSAFEQTLKTGRAVYFSRSKNHLWTKGEESGNFQLVKEILIDCDNDSVLLKVEQVGNAACHTGYRSCYYRKLENGKFKIISKKIFNQKAIYKKSNRGNKK